MQNKVGLATSVKKECSPPHPSPSFMTVSSSSTRVPSGSCSAPACSRPVAASFTGPNRRPFRASRRMGSRAKRGASPPSTAPSARPMGEAPASRGSGGMGRGVAVDVDEDVAVAAVAPPDDTAAGTTAAVATATAATLHSGRPVSASVNLPSANVSRRAYTRDTKCSRRYSPASPSPPHAAVSRASRAVRRAARMGLGSLSAVAAPTPAAAETTASRDAAPLPSADTAGADDEAHAILLVSGALAAALPATGKELGARAGKEGASRRIKRACTLGTREGGGLCASCMRMLSASSGKWVPPL